MNSLDNILAKTLQTSSEMLEKRHNDSYQRRNQVVDNYGIEYSRQGSSQSPASFLISVSPDLIYYERFEFKIIISAFTLPVADGINVTPTAVSISNVSLDISSTTSEMLSENLDIEVDEQTGETAISPNPHNHTQLSHSHAISPNPHTHMSTPHTHDVVAGVTNLPVTAENFRIEIEGIDITPFLIVQRPGGWLDGSGIFPSSSPTVNFDILEVVGLLSENQRNQILGQGYKTISIFGDGLFNATYVSYLKYSHVNR